MFRRTSKEEQSPTPVLDKGPGAKGRPTPTRKEAEAASRERAKAGMDKKTAQKVLRQRRTEENAKIRAGMRSGDERYLPARDQGPVKRFIRDFIDARLSVAEFLLPLLVIIMVLQYSPSAQLKVFGQYLWTATIFLTVIDTLWTTFRLKRALKARFPDESTKGTTFYMVMRLMQLRWLRMPKPKVKLGGAPR